MDINEIISHNYSTGKWLLYIVDRSLNKSLPPHIRKKKYYELTNSTSAFILNAMFETSKDIRYAVKNAPESLEQFKKELREKKLPNIIIKNLNTNIREHTVKWYINPNIIKVNELTFRRTERINGLLLEHPEQDVVALLVRYWMIQLRKEGSSYQWSFNYNKFSNIDEMAKNIIEAFASPLNNSFPNYCSLFPEDKQFGSLGSFFEQTNLSGKLWLINPPFTEMIMDTVAKIVDKMDKFIFIMPNWEDSEAFTILEKKYKYTSKTESYWNPQTCETFTPRFKTVIFHHFPK